MSIPVLLAAFLGTIAFSILYSIPTRYVVFCGLNGLIGWIVYSIIGLYAHTLFAIFFATVAIYVFARIFAVHLKCPEIVFLIPGIFPIVPGAGIYWTAYYFIAGNFSAASVSGTGAIKACLAMVLAIALVHELPQGLFFGKKRATDTKAVK
ncbi:MAG: threonine/serine exporter [Spirochaetales bacterium]|nr:threonine/serine exporter [Spirochaetales bacterium]